MRNKKVRMITESAVMIGLAAILSLIKVYEAPLGGSVTALSMLPVILIALRYGAGWGVFTGVVYGSVQLLLDFGKIGGWGLTPVMFGGTIFFDYLFAFGILGIAGLMRNRRFGMFTGTAMAIAGRFLMHFFSGILFFAQWAGEGYTPVTWSVAYNGAYLLPELILTLIGIWLISKTPLAKMIKE